MGESELDRIAFVMPEQRQLIQQWLREDIAAEAAPDNRAPWASMHWFEEVTTWVQEQLEQLNIQVSGPMT